MTRRSGCSARSRPATRRRAAGRTAGSRRWCPFSQSDLAPKIARQGADEDKHGRIFTALLRKRGPGGRARDADYTMRLEKAGIGLAHARLRGGEELTERDFVTYLAHSQVTGQRASKQMQALRKYAGDRTSPARSRSFPPTSTTHLANCHEELLRLAAAGHAPFIRRTLRTAALVEMAIYRDVSTAVMAYLGQILDWPGRRPPCWLRASGRSTPGSGSAAGGAWRRCACRPAATRWAAQRPAVSTPDTGNGSISQGLCDAM